MILTRWQPDDELTSNNRSDRAKRSSGSSLPAARRIIPERRQYAPPSGLLIVAAVCLITTQPGCAFREWFTRKMSPAPPRVLPVDATLDEITDHLNQDRSRLMSWRSDDVSIKARGEGVLAPRLSANLSVESPRNLRMIASSPIAREVDFGSNSERFWFWMKRMDPKIQLTGTHDGAGQQQVLQLPFPPSWLMEALGVVPIDMTGVQLSRESSDSDQVRLVSTQLIEGQPVQRIMVVDLAQGQIVEHALYNDRDELIASAVMSDFRTVDEDLRMPHQIELIWPQAKVTLSMKIRNIEINPTMPSQLWEMTAYPDYQLVDLDRNYAELR